MQIKAALLILAGASVALRAQDVAPTALDSNTTASAEQAAVKYALDSAGVHGGKLVVDPLLAPMTMAPGRGSDLRPVWRTDLLAAFLKASSRERDKAISCASNTSLGPRCDLIDADRYITASEPRFDGGLATVTVTIEERGPRGAIDYRTYNIVMTNTSNGWKVMKMELLGIS
jgi:hypothetical protein